MVKQRDVKVLVVDDDPEACELVAKILEPLGFTVIRAANGEEGVELARQAAPDLVILDLVMPGISGFEVVRILKADLYTRAIPVLVVTAKDITPKDKKALRGTWRRCSAGLARVDRPVGLARGCAWSNSRLFHRTGLARNPQCGIL
jgi:CheY-like chemotaxis protein